MSITMNTTSSMPDGTFMVLIKIFFFVVCCVAYNVIYLRVITGSKQRAIVSWKWRADTELLELEMSATCRRHVGDRRRRRQILADRACRGDMSSVWWTVKSRISVSARHFHDTMARCFKPVITRRQSTLYATQHTTNKKISINTMNMNVLSIMLLVVFMVIDIIMMSNYYVVLHDNK